jgi:type IV secretory pathway TraG/TraD family ATPase VirD4
VLAGMKNQIFLPGIDPETGAYASSMLGPTTVLSRTEVDATGTSNDAERVSESRRELRQAPELRRLVKYRQGIAIIDTADPILFRFLPRADVGDVAVPPEREIAEPERLAEAVSAMKLLKDTEKKRVEGQQINELSAQQKERANHREEPGVLPKPTLEPVDLEIIESESREEGS